MLTYPHLCVNESIVLWSSEAHSLVDSLGRGSDSVCLKYNILGLFSFLEYPGYVTQFSSGIDHCYNPVFFLL